MINSVFLQSPSPFSILIHVPEGKLYRLQPWALLGGASGRLLGRRFEGDGKGDRNIYIPHPTPWRWLSPLTTASSE